LIIVLDIDAATEELERDLHDRGYVVHILKGDDHILLYVMGDTTELESRALNAYDGVKNVLRTKDPYRYVNRSLFADRPLRIGKKPFSEMKPFIIAGPCAVESREQIVKIAEKVASAGAHALRGGAFKPRTSPHAFQGLEREGLMHLRKAADAFDLFAVSEIMDKEDLPFFEEHVDIIQVGARNMQNHDLLKALGKAKKPILLKRGFANTVEEWLLSAEYLIMHGNRDVILCERGIRTFDSATRHTLDLNGMLYAKQITELPVIVDPSHAAGDYRLVEGLSKASIAAGADGLMIEVHNNPFQAFSDGAQSLKPKRFEKLMKAIAVYTE